MTTGERIQKARKAKKLSQRELGEMLGVSGSMIGQYENNLRKPKYETLVKIASQLDVSPHYLAKMTDDPRTWTARTVSDEEDDLGVAVDMFIDYILRLCDLEYVKSSYENATVDDNRILIVQRFIQDNERTLRQLMGLDVEKKIISRKDEMPFLTGE